MRTIELVCEIEGLGAVSVVAQYTPGEKAVFGGPLENQYPGSSPEITDMRVMRADEELDVDALWVESTRIDLIWHNAKHQPYFTFQDAFNMYGGGLQKCYLRGNFFHRNGKVMQLQKVSEMLADAVLEQIEQDGE